MSDSVSSPDPQTVAAPAPTDNSENPDNSYNSENSEAGAPSAAPAPSEKRRYAWLAVLTLILCVAAWVASTFNGYTTIVLCVASIVCGAFSLGSRRAVVRNTSITAIIASAVLLLVVGAFMIALKKLLG